MDSLTHFQCLTLTLSFAAFVGKDKRPAKCYLLACIGFAFVTVVTENL